MKIAITGHRPEKLPLDESIYRDAIIDGLTSLAATHIYQGMAAGIDILSHEGVEQRQVPIHVIACVPYRGHKKYNRNWSDRWQWCYDNASEVVELSESIIYPGPWVFHNRNHYMVDNAQAVLSVYDGSPKGGTKACIEYAIKKNVPVFNIHPATLVRTRLNP